MKAKYGWLQLETGPRGADLFAHNPTFDKITVLDHGKLPPEELDKAASVRWGTLMDCFPWDYATNLWRTLEVECIAEEWQEAYHWPREKRRTYFGDKVFAEQPFIRGGFPIPAPFTLGTHYFPPNVGYWMADWKKQNKDYFVVAIIVAGSTCQKVPVGLKQVAEKIMKRYPKVRFYLLGAGSGWMNIKAKDLQFSFGMKNVAQMVDKTDYHHAMAIAKMADYVIGPISSLMHAAGLFGTPKTTICSDCSVEQACKYHANDFSIVSHAPCAPCHRAIYHDKYCLTMDTEHGKLPACNVEWSDERIIQGIDFAYAAKQMRAEAEVIDGRNAFSSLPDFRGTVIAGRPFGDLMNRLSDRRGMNIVEIGSTREDWNISRDGYSTPYFAALAKGTESRFWTVDIEPKAAEVSQAVLSRYGLLSPDVSIVTDDGVRFLERWNGEPIDVLYLDAWDADEGREDESAAKHLEAFQKVEDKIPPGGYVLIDDMKDDTEHGFFRKGKLLFPYMVERGYKVLDRGYQVLLQKDAA